MPEPTHQPEHTQIHREISEQLRRLAQGARSTSGRRQLTSIQVEPGGANGGVGAALMPGLNVGEVTETTLPLIGVTVAGDGDLTVLLSQDDDGSGTYNVLAVTLQVVDPTTGDYGYASGSLNPLPHTGAWPPTMSSTGSSGTAFTWSGTGWRRATPGPVMGWVQVAVLRTS